MVTCIYTKKQICLIIPYGHVLVSYTCQILGGQSKELEGLKRKRNVDIGWGLRRSGHKAIAPIWWVLIPIFHNINYLFPKIKEVNARNGNSATDKFATATNWLKWRNGVYFRCIPISASHFPLFITELEEPFWFLVSSLESEGELLSWFQTRLCCFELIWM